MKAIQAYPSGGGRLQSIDALRGIAALGVVFYHAAWQSGNAVPANVVRLPVQFLQFFSSFGYIGVFFVLRYLRLLYTPAVVQSAREPTTTVYSVWNFLASSLSPALSASSL